ncbi:hypothetical protein F5Y08DRAFT_174119 [Xylaria arbuscula]|nr:hypothetical protein F5Y08DRAFT_174119 [Xylaria arbuscula]
MGFTAIILSYVFNISWRTSVLRHWICSLVLVGQYLGLGAILEKGKCRIPGLKLFLLGYYGLALVILVIYQLPRYLLVELVGIMNGRMQIRIPTLMFIFSDYCHLP